MDTKDIGSKVLGMLFIVIVIVLAPLPTTLYLFFVELFNLLYPKHKLQTCLGWNLGITIVVLALIELSEIVLLCLRQPWYVTGVFLPILFLIIIGAYIGIDELLDRRHAQDINTMHFSALMEHIKAKMRHRGKSKTAQE